MECPLTASKCKRNIRSSVRLITKLFNLNRVFAFCFCCCVFSFFYLTKKLPRSVGIFVKFQNESVLACVLDQGEEGVIGGVVKKTFIRIYSVADVASSPSLPYITRAHSISN